MSSFIGIAVPFRVDSSVAPCVFLPACVRWLWCERQLKSTLRIHMYLTKSDFKIARTCPTKLYYKKCG